MDRGNLAPKVAIDYLYDVLLKRPQLRLTPNDSRKRTKAQLFLVGRDAKELYVIVNDSNAKSTKILIEHPLTVTLPGVREDLNANPHKAQPVKDAAASRNISIGRQHTVYVDSTEALDQLISWYANSDGTGAAIGSGGDESEPSETGELSSENATGGTKGADPDDPPLTTELPSPVVDGQFSATY